MGFHSERVSQGEKDMLAQLRSAFERRLIEAGHSVVDDYGRAGTAFPVGL